VVALDTEFMRVRTFHAQAALFQSATAKPLPSIHSPSPTALLARLLAARRAQGDAFLLRDLEVCERHPARCPSRWSTRRSSRRSAATCCPPVTRGCSPRNSACTSASPDAHRRAGGPSPAQIHYAAEDGFPARAVRAAQRLAGKLAGDWAREECAATVARFACNADWRALGGAWWLDPRGLVALSALHAWREEIVRTRPAAQLAGAGRALCGWRNCGRSEGSSACRGCPASRRYGAPGAGRHGAALDAAELLPQPPLDTPGAPAEVLRALAITWRGAGCRA
jgi:hypothetical protein